MTSPSSQDHHHPTWCRASLTPRVPPRRTVGALLAAAAALSLVACNSALKPDYSNRDNNAYYQSLIAREIMKGATPATGFAAGTIDGGVHEYTRIDEPGAAPAPATFPTPGTTPSIANASLIGLPYANLNTAEPTFNLSLQDAIARAASHSLAIKVEAYNPAIKEALIISAEAAFDPILFGQSQMANNDDPAFSYNSSNGLQWQNQIGIKRMLPSGGTVQATVNSNYRDINTFGASAGVLAPPFEKNFWASNINLQLQQPLLRGFGSDVNQANIYLAQRDLRITLSEFKQNTMKTIADVEDAYQSLVLSRVNVEVLVRLVVASEQTYNDIMARKDLDATVASINQAKSALESRRADLFVAQKTMRNASDRLKTALNDPEIDINSNVLITPTDRPTIEPMRYDLADCIQTALRQRPEMQQARLQIERADIVMTVAQNALLPQLDMVGSLQTGGLDHGFDQSMVRTVDPMNHIDLVFGLKFEIPIGNREAEARLAQHRTERNQAITNMVQIAQHVVQDVKSQLREVLSDYQEIAIRDRVRQTAALELQGIIDIENIRARTPEFMQLKLDSQARLTQSEQGLIQSIVNYNLAVMRLEQAKGTLLEFDRISLDHPPAPKDDVLSKLRIMGSTYVTK